MLARSHPDLYVLEPLGEMIRIDEIRELHHDLHMRPFEATRRVYLVLDAHRLNDDAADALLKDLEEPPSYAIIVLVADELGPLPETIRSRCQLVPFRRLSEQAVRDWLAEHAQALSEQERTALARVAAGRLDRARRLLDPAAQERREALIAVARSVYRDPAFDPGDAAGVLLAAGSGRRRRGEGAGGGAARGRRPDPEGGRAAREARRARCGARGAAGAARGARRLVPRPARRRRGGRPTRLCTPTGSRSFAPTTLSGSAAAPERAAGLVREAWRSAEEFNVNTTLWLEALFVRLRRAFA